MGHAHAQSCSLPAQVKFPDGSVGCLSELPFAKEIAKELKFIERSTTHAIAISKNNQCKAIGVSTSTDPVWFVNFPLIQSQQQQVAIDKCKNQGCECELVIVDGVSKVNKSFLISMFVNTDNQSVVASKPPAKETIISAAPVKDRPTGEVKAKDESAAAKIQTQSCSLPAQVKFPDGSVGCLSELPFAKEIAKELKFIERSTTHAIAISKNNQCKAIGVSTSTDPVWFVNFPLIQSQQQQVAIDKCKNQGCECELVIVDGVSKVNKSFLISMFVNTDNQSVVASKPPAKETIISAAPVKDRPTGEVKAKDESAAAKITDGQISALRYELEKEIRSRLLAEAAQNNAAASIATQKPARMYANRKALVIGNDAYQKVSSLLNAREDARLMAETLNNFGFKVQLKLDVTEKQFKSELRNFKNSIQPGDEVAIFYAGHGIQISSTNYLLPIDISGQNEEEIKDEAIPLQRILDDMNEKGAKFALAMIDACRDNPFKSTARNIGGTRGLAPTTAATGQMIVFSAGSGQQALDRLGPTDKNKNGLFTRVFVQEMQKTGVSVDRVVRNARSKVVEMAKSVGHNQVPAIYDQVVGEFYFRQ